MEWNWDPGSPNYTEDGGSTLGTAFSQQTNHNDESLFIREVISNCADQRLKDNTEPTRVYIDVIELKGEPKNLFKDRIKWPKLKKHLDKASINRNTDVIHNNLYHGMQDIHKKDPIILVKISDYNTNGLVGDEYPNNDMEGPQKLQNFHLLTKANHVTHGDNMRQGTYGLGKGVLYHKSKIRTVLMSSRTKDKPDKYRFIGRSDLGFHRFGNLRTFSGPGYLGDTCQRNKVDAVKSKYDLSDKELEELFLDRPDGSETGTTILSVCYSIDGRDIQNLIKTFKKDIQKWFWPALIQEDPQLKVFLREFHNKDNVSSERVVVAENSTFGLFYKAYASEDETILHDNDEYEIPSKREIEEELDRGFTAKADMNIFKSQANDDNNNDDVKNCIALLRNDLCVVEYRPIKGNIDDNYTFSGVYKAGLARSNTSEDQAFHEFLRQAEPPFHNNWMHGDKIRAFYKASTTDLRKLRDGIDGLAVKLCESESTDSEDNLDHLSQYFKFGNVGLPPPPPKDVSFKIRDYIINNLDIELDLEIANERADSNDWTAEIALKIEGVNSVKIPIGSTNFKGNKKLMGGRLRVTSKDDMQKIDLKVYASIPKLFTPEEAKKLTFIVDTRSIRGSI